MKNRTLLLSPADHHRRAAEQILGHDVEEHKLSDEADYGAVGRINVIVTAPEVYLQNGPTADEDELVYAIEELEPELFVIETVRGLAAPRWADEFDALLGDLEGPDDGDPLYRVAHKILQIDGRHRMVIIGRKDKVEPTFNTARRNDAAVCIANLITENLRRAS